MEIPWKEMTTDQRIRFMDNLRADQQSRIPSKPPGVTALASPAGLGATALDRVQLIAWQTSQQGTTLGADLATLESMLKQATL